MTQLPTPALHEGARLQSCRKPSTRKAASAAEVGRDAAGRKPRQSGGKDAGAPAGVGAPGLASATWVCRTPTLAIALALAFAFLSVIPAGNLLFAQQSQSPTGQHVLQLTQQLLAVAPKRFNGSPGHAAAERFVKDHFAPEIKAGNFTDDTFVANTPAGPQTMHNLLVKYPGKRDGTIVLASHYETNYNLKDINFVGANDGACTSALLIALGEYLRIHPPTGYSVYLLFDDGEESVSGDWTNQSDQLYGTRHLAAKWSGDGTLPHVKAFVLADMIGWKDMRIDRELNSAPWLEQDLTLAARQTGHAALLASTGQAIEDDHIPFKLRDVPVLDVICYEYGTKADPEAFHHHEGDTLDKLSAQNLGADADIFLALLRLINGR